MDAAQGIVLLGGDEVAESALVRPTFGQDQLEVSGSDRQAKHLDPGAGELRAGKLLDQATAEHKVDAIRGDARLVDKALTPGDRFLMGRLNRRVARHQHEAGEFGVTPLRLLQILYQMTEHGRFVLGPGGLDAIDLAPQVNPCVGPAPAGLAFRAKGAEVEARKSFRKADAGVVLRHTLHIGVRETRETFGDARFELAARGHPSPPC